MRRVLLVSAIALIAATGCSKSTSITESPPTTAATSTSAPKGSAAADDRRICAAFDAFWNTAYSGGEPDATMVARERDLLNAVEAGHDETMHDAVRGVIQGELGLPAFYLHDSEAAYERQRSTLSADAKAALESVTSNERTIVAMCAAVGQPISQ